MLIDLISVPTRIPLDQTLEKRVRVLENQLKSIQDLLFKENSDFKIALFPEYLLGRTGISTSSNEVSRFINKVREISLEYPGVLIIPGTGLFKEGGDLLNKGWFFFEGEIVSDFSKKRPFDRELRAGVKPGTTKNSLVFKGLHLKTVVCADLWFPELN